ncbi:MAG: hypothetical protein AB8B64_08085 [Granulosicoccus sp.]
MKSSPTLRVLMAAGMYLLLMWGYVTLPTPQLYAVFAALIMSIALLFWVSEARALEQLSRTIETERVAACNSVTLPGDDIPSLCASMERLDRLKSELTQQYAQFGRDQALMNGKGLGTWNRKPPGHQGDES